MKKCCTCKIEKEKDKFGLRKTGRLNYECKECVALRSRKYYESNRERCNEKRKKLYQKNREKVLEKCKERYWKNHTEIRRRANEQNRCPERRAKANERGKLWAKNNRERHIELSKQHRKKHPEKYAARTQIFWAVKLGFMKQSETCEECKKMIKTQAHHDDYQKPLEVRWLCRQCHADWHRLNKD